MNQRLTLAAVGVMTAAAVTLCLLTWMMFQQGREVNAAILAKLETLSAGPEQPTDSLEWTELTVRCVKGKKDGPPASDFTVRFLGKAINPSEDIIVKGMTGSNGEVHFSPIRPGAYEMSIASPWNAISKREIVVFPGREHTEIIVCPEGPPEKTQVTFDVKWPADLQEERLAVRIFFALRGHQLDLGDLVWRDHYRDPHFEAILTNDGKLLNADFKMTPDRLAAARSARMRIPPTRGPVIYTYRKKDLWDEPMRTVFVGPYRLTIQEVYTVEDVPTDPATRGMRSLLNPRRRLAVSRSDSPDAPEEQGQDDLVLHATAGELNPWRIELPEDLREQIRAALAEVEGESESRQASE